VRLARRDEAAQLADLWLRSRGTAVPAIPPPVHSDEEVRAWFADVVLPTKEVWVVEGQTVLALLVLDGHWLDQLYVDPCYTGRGLGSVLVELAKTQRSYLDLWTFQANHRARGFYERHGFEVVSETDGDNEEGAPDVRYRWSA